MTEAEQQDMNERIRKAYVAAMHQSHSGGRVEIHLGADVLEYLRSLVTVPMPWSPRPTLFNIPITTNEAYPADHIAVHTVNHIL